MKKEDLLTAIDQANITFKKIMVNYPGLLGYLVLSSPYGQCGLTGDPLQILKEFHTMISDSEVKGNVIKLLETIRELENKYAARGNMNAEVQTKIDKASHLLNANVERMEFKEDTFIEIRFKTDRLLRIFKIDLELIFKMQKDPLVSQLHTPQTQASIRIVLGTLTELTTRVENFATNKDEINP
jgi:hypothetical protein